MCVCLAVKEKNRSIYISGIVARSRLSHCRPAGFFAHTHNPFLLAARCVFVSAVAVLICFLLAPLLTHECVCVCFCVGSEKSFLLPFFSHELWGWGLNLFSLKKIALMFPASGNFGSQFE
jgi:hypothetical protein